MGQATLLSAWRAGSFLVPRSPLRPNSVFRPESGQRTESESTLYGIISDSLIGSNVFGKPLLGTSVFIPNLGIIRIYLGRSAHHVRAH